MKIVNVQYVIAKDILRKYATQHNQIRDLLVEREVIYHDDVEKILGKRQWKSRTDEIIELSKKEEEKEKLNPDNNDDSEFIPADGFEITQDDSDPGPPPPFTK